MSKSNQTTGGPGMKTNEPHDNNDPLIVRPTAAQAADLSKELKGLREAADKLSRRTKRNEWAVALTVLGLTADVVLTVFLITSNIRVNNSIHAQCGLYQLLIPSWRGAPPPGNPVSPAQYRDAYIQMQNTADLLDCGIKHVVPGT
jgi:hypothetical protein